MNEKYLDASLLASNRKRFYQIIYKVLPGIEPGFEEFSIKILSDNHYTIAPHDGLVIIRVMDYGCDFRNT